MYLFMLSSAVLGYVCVLEFVVAVYNVLKKSNIINRNDIDLVFLKLQEGNNVLLFTGVRGYIRE